MKRPPLWTTLIPLVAGAVLYHQWWAKQSDAFAADVAGVFGPGGDSGGFPYRLETEYRQPNLTFDHGDARASLSGDAMAMNKQPIGEGPVVGRVLRPRVSLSIPSMAGVDVRIAANSSMSSLRMAEAHIARFSTVFDQALLTAGLFGATATADSFEVHFRETPSAAVAGRDPRFPVQDEVVLSGTGVRYAKGDPLTLDASIDLTAAKPVRSLAAWQPGGTVEVRRFRLTDKVGEVLTVSATVTPTSDGALMVAGIVDTVCPASLEALFAGRSLSGEYRARHPIRYSFSGPASRLQLSATTLTRVPVRNQEPPCPVLRR